MKYILTILFFSFFINAIAQYPIQQSMGSTTTQVTAKGAFGTKDGMVFTRYYADTTEANNTPYVPNIAGMVIRVNQTDFFVRNEALNRWVQINGSGGEGTVTGGNEGITLNGANVQFGSATQNASSLSTNRYINTNGKTINFTSGDNYFQVLVDSSIATGIGALKLSGAYGGNIDLISTNTSVPIFPSINWTYGGNFKFGFGLDVGPGRPNQFFFDCPNTSNGVDAYAFEFGGVSQILLQRVSGNTFIGLRNSKRTGFGGQAAPGQTVSITGSLSNTDSVIFRGLTTGSNTDSFLTVLGGMVRMVAASALPVPTLQQTITAGSTFTGINTYVGANFPQKYTFNSLQGYGDAGGAGLELISTSTAASGSDQTLFRSGLSGANANSGQITYAAQFENTHTGSSSTNVAAWFNAQGGTLNYAAQFRRGTVSFGTNTIASGIIEINGGTTGTITIQPASTAGTYTLTLPTDDGTPSQFLQTDGSGVLTWATASSAVAWNGITNPTGTQTLSFDDAELNAWTNGSNTETFWTIDNNSQTTGTSLKFNSSTLTSGNIIDIAITGTGGLTNQTGINVSLSGANGTGAQTTYGAKFSNTHTGTSVNVGAEFIASGGSTNTAIRVASGNGRVAIGQLNAAASLDVVGTAILDAIQTNSTGGNSSFFVGSSAGFTGSSTAAVQLLGSSTVDFRTLENGATATTGTTGRPYFTHIIGASSYTEPGSGTITAIGSLALRSPTVTAAAGAVTDGATLYIEGRVLATATNQTTAMWIDNGIVKIDDTLALGTGAPSAQLHTTGTVRMANFGAGTATFDASGNVSSVSDPRLKFILGSYQPGLNELMDINPILYKWRPESGMETEHTYGGFDAQNVFNVLGESGTGVNSQGYRSVQDRALIAMLINSVKELNAKVELLQRKNK